MPPSRGASDRNRRCAGDAGFTLIEVLAALVIMSLLLVASGSVVRLVTGAGERGSRATERADMQSRALGAVRGDLMRIERAVVRRKDKLGYAFSGNARALNFAAIEPAFPTEPGSYKISYRVEGTDGAARLVRSRAAFDPANERIGDTDRVSAQAAEDGVEVMSGPYRIAFAYYDGAARRWLDAWRAMDRLPQLIRLTVTPSQAGVAPVAPLVVRPRVDAETTCAGATPPCAARDGQLLPPPPQPAPAEEAAPTVPTLTPSRAGHP